MTSEVIPYQLYYLNTCEIDWNQISHKKENNKLKGVGISIEFIKLGFPSKYYYILKEDTIFLNCNYCNERLEKCKYPEMKYHEKKEVKVRSCRICIHKKWEDPKWTIKEDNRYVGCKVNDTYNAVLEYILSLIERNEDGKIQQRFF